jgi:YD repeat-containing protein
VEAQLYKEPLFMALTCFRSKPSARTLCLAQILFLLVLLTATVRSQSSNEIVYVYDELGRLVAVVDLAGEAAVYTYDAVGNLLSISRYSSSVVSIIEFTPNSGSIGTAVTIYGTGFSTTPSQNAITFNGVAAAVASATSTQIITSVPAGATTGPIAITTPTGTATSSTSFIVGQSGPPTITEFTPTIGVSGTAVTITGTNFETSPHNNKARFNVTYSAITSATNTTIATTVP